MDEQVFNFNEPTRITLTGETATGTKKVTETVREVVIKVRASSVGFSWVNKDGSTDSISFVNHNVDASPAKISNYLSEQ